jgi:serine O-acetyltransferase
VDYENSVVSSDEPDWSREAKGWIEWAPSKSLLGSIRRWQHYKARRGIVSLILSKWFVISHRFWSVVTGADIPINARIGGGLVLPHPNGVVVHADAVIGPNCLLFQQVTLGTRDGSQPPELKGHVDVGAGAKILGNLTVGEHAKIGANAVVLADVPAHHVAVGIPAVNSPIPPKLPGQ